MRPFDENDLIAYHLHELSPRRARALEQALRNDRALAAASAEYMSMLRAFKNDAPLTVDKTLLDRNWNALRPSLSVLHTPPRMTFRWQMPALAAAGLAFAATATFVLTQHARRAASSPSSATHAANLTTATNAAALPAPTPFETSSVRDTPAALAPSASGHLSAQDAARSHRITLVAPTPIIMLGSPSGNSRSIFIPSTPTADLHLIPLATNPSPDFLPATRPVITFDPPHARQSDGGSRGASSHLHAWHTHAPTDITLAIGGTLIPRHNFAGGEVYLGASHAVSAIGALHQQFKPAAGYGVTLSYTRPDFQYGYLGAATNIGASIYELAATYVVRGPHPGRLSTSAEAGVGVLRLTPDGSYPGAQPNTLPAAVAGLSTEVTLTKHLALHAGYRAQLFKGPHFHEASTPNFPYGTNSLISNEPSLGITYRFTHQ